MKPHIAKVRGLWCCIGSGAFGLGYDPLHAYDDWKKSSQATGLSTVAQP